MAKGQCYFGHKELAAQLVNRLQRHFVKESNVDTLLVIGIFGEWGCGKSNLLHLVDEGFGSERDQVVKEGNQPPVIVIPFNPWRYEKEEHLLPPLLKNTKLVIEQHTRENKSLWEKLDLLDRTKESARFFGVASLAFMQAFNGKVIARDIAELEFDPEKFIQGIKEGSQEKNSVFDRLESYYFEFEQFLSKYSRGDKSFR